MTPSSRSGLVAPARQLSADYPGILIHTGASHAAAAADVCASEGMGVVLSVGRTRQGRSAVDALLEQHQARGADLGHVLLDAEAYAGAKRARGPDPIQSAWVRMQWAAGCEWALTNSGFIDEGDLDAMSGVLHAGAAIGGQTITALPIHPSWLRRDARGLAQLINAAGQPVALMVQHTADPFGVRDNVRGLVALLDYADVPLLLLRSDLSSLGAVAFGASAGAIGTTTTRRHIWPSKRGGSRHTPSIAALVPSLMDFNRLSKINDAILYGSDPMWICNCDLCFGRDLSWITTSEEAFSHTLRAVARMAEAVFDPALDSVQRRNAWISRCKVAQVRHFEASDIARTEWKPPAFLGQWVAMQPELQA